MRFVLIRHGQSGNNALFEATGDERAGRDPDTALTELGHDQSRRLAHAVAQGVLPWRPTALYSSLMTRAIQTAAPLAEVLDLPICGHPELFECGGPHEIHPETGNRLAHPGSPRTVLAALTDRVELPDAAQEWGWWRGPHEDTDALRAARAARVIAGLRATHADDEVVALVTHGWFTQFLLREFIGGPSITAWFDIKNTGISLLSDGAGEWVGTMTAERINWLPHLESALVPPPAGDVAGVRAG
jgi:2,3-bisphosphoglycerate-dependent phosphoglycerate mutase